MKLLFTFYNPSGGMETLNRIRCKILQANGFDCHMLYKQFGSGMQNIKDTKVHIASDPQEIAELIRAEGYDAIIVNSDAQLMEDIRLAGFDKPILYEVQGLGTYETAQAVLQAGKSQIQRYATGLLYPRTGHLIELMNLYFPDKPHFICSNPLDTEAFGYRYYDLHTAPILGWVGRIEHNKNWEDFIELGHRLVQSEPSLYLWLFSDPDLYDPKEKVKFEQKIEEYQLASRLIYHANVPHSLMADYLSIIGDSGGFLCSSSRVEGFGYAVAEALLCRCPVLSTASDGVQHFIIQGQTGLFYTLGDFNDATEKAEQLLFNAELRRQLRDQGEKYIKEHFSPRGFLFEFKAMLAALGMKHNPL